MTTERCRMGCQYLHSTVGDDDIAQVAGLSQPSRTADRSLVGPRATGGQYTRSKPRSNSAGRMIPQPSLDARSPAWAPEFGNGRMEEWELEERCRQGGPVPSGSCRAATDPSLYLRPSVGGLHYM